MHGYRWCEDVAVVLRYCLVKWGFGVAAAYGWSTLPGTLRDVALRGRISRRCLLHLCDDHALNFSAAEATWSELRSSI